ncbi:choice-of-anchor Q domain-containing protein [Fibrella aquatilis]|uniref:Right handed beta helix domain-containing protein n=1 Tax=Fibrella aquatilis TaxID=2817059 RepID=A0A939G676_9BACT|nr:choice-of-anchor Q domain-containing protein [Fibrella aquatilis]MBO0930543.1 hypothetical protein [Fibrella aquatilis]
MPTFPQLLFCLFLSLSALSQPIIRVTTSGAGDRTGSSWANALSGTALAGSVASATPGTQFWVAAGTYKPTTTGDRMASFSIASGVQVYGGFVGSESALNERIAGTNETTFSGDIYNTPYTSTDNSVHVMSVQNASQLIILNSITVFGGHISGFDYGSSGAGLYINQSAPLSLSLSVINCNFIGNQIENWMSGGGAIIAKVDNYASVNLSITGSYFSGNKAGFGGAYAPYQDNGGSVSTLIDNCLFINNEGLYAGGAIDQSYSSADPLNTLTIKRCKFISNNGTYKGGAISLGYNQTRVSECIFSSNGVSNYGYGGGAISGSGAANSIFTNCIFSKNIANYGGALYSTSDNSVTKLIFRNCTFFNNQAYIAGGAFYAIFFTGTQPSPFLFNRNDTILENCIVWQNTAPDSPVYKDQYWISFESDRIKNSFLPTYSDLQESYPGIGNISVEPAFIDPYSNNYRLLANSPAINTGDPIITALPTSDYAGQPRVQNGRVDMGAYESACLPAPCIPITAVRK